MEERTWEYCELGINGVKTYELEKHVQERQVDLDDLYRDMRKIMAELGLDGWELVSVIEHSVAPTFYFKRRIS
jgi:hypothetical protein